MLPPPALEQANDQGCARYRARQPDARVNECNRDVTPTEAAPVFTMQSADYNQPMLRWNMKNFLLLIAVSVIPGSVVQAGVPTGEIAAVDEVPKPVNKNGRWGYANGTGRFVIRPKYFAAEPFSEGLALVVTRKPWQPLGNEYGEFRLAQITYIDRSGHEIIKPQFDGLSDFSEGLAAVNLGANCGTGGKWGYVGKEGQTVIPFKFLWAEPFHNGRACVGERPREEEVIDRSGNIIPGEKCR